MIDNALLKAQLGRTLRQTHLKALGPPYRGKVRDVYTIDGLLVLITTDRISAFDHVLRQTIPFKGQVLNQLAAYFFRHTADVVPNHVVAVPDPNVTVARRCRPIPVEFVVRGYLAGHAWRLYQSGLRQLCGKRLPEGLVQNERLPQPILTPTTKASEGHDEDISREEILARGWLDAETFDQLEQLALKLFQRGTEMAARRGLILVDTKYEFGVDEEGTLRLIDEVHTPDSSRYFYAEEYEERLRKGLPQRQLSKEFVREWLMAQGFMGKPGQVLPDLPDEVRLEIAQRYILLYEELTGETFVPDLHPDPEARIEENLKQLEGLQLSW
ncbi:phosphoribosylaminoimidazolesuccinocarboxamide synthase [Rhodothermus bifroesti]|jgi:phosphoribosylaminoimidazole-succinocarboxamide synthase|uniref:Phosphoribosylaminoimidazole-succinocarboxamide synthase n=1 Tax=Rhodothermus marinus TaxID=29549 RepID=A0A7V2B0U5_RHOMR|nr:phosphoribosylaminoimidazolesuccinocarboxamide synthase [Rhodothermus bifroesti]GBD00559.1 Phosphoribosylaminoimidazole-succinocarboxamide synthase [bacterium HR18]